MPDLPEEQIYPTLGDDGFRRLVAAFYARIAADDIIGPLYPKHDLPGAEERLRLFLVQRFGGPTTYSDQRGHPRLRMRHAPFAVTVQARNRWMEIMEAAMIEAEVPAEAVGTLRKYFATTATFMMNA